MADWIFLLGVLFKGIDGLVEVLVGLPLLFVSAAQVSRWAGRLTADELAEDPDSFVANLILHGSARLEGQSLLIGGVNLLVHGLVKLGIVVTLIRGTRRAYPWAIGALTVLLLVQLSDLAVRFSWGVVFLTVLDVLVLWMTVTEWRHSRTLGDVLRLRTPWLCRR